MRWVPLKPVPQEILDLGQERLREMATGPKAKERMVVGKAVRDRGIPPHMMTGRFNSRCGWPELLLHTEHREIREFLTNEIPEGWEPLIAKYKAYR